MTKPIPAAQRKQSWPVAGWIFLAAVAALYAGVAIEHPETVRSALVAFRYMAERVLPPLIVAYLLITAFNVYLPPERLRRFLGSQTGARGWLAAIGLGVLSLGPIYPWYVVLGALKSRGLRPSLAAAFLYARAVKPPLVPLLVHYFGTLFTVILLAYLLLFSVITGLIVGATIRWEQTREQFPPAP